MPFGVVTDLPVATKLDTPQWEVLADALVASTLIFDRNVMILVQNKAHEKMTGTSRDRIVGRYAFDAFPSGPQQDTPSAEAAIRDSVAHVWETQIPDVLPIQHHALRDENGNWQPRSWKVTHAPIIQNGETVAILQTSEDVTTSNLTKAMGDAERLAAQDAAAVSYFSYEIGSEKFARSDSVDALFGFAPGEAGDYATPFFDRIHEDDLPDVRAELERLATSEIGEPAKFDFRSVLPDKETPNYIRVRGALVIDPNDLRTKLVGVFIDLTEIETARRELEQTIEEKENLLIEVNHRVKNSLQLASSILRLEARKSPGDETKRVLEKANARIDAIAEVHGGIYLGGDVTRAPCGELVHRIVDALGRSVGAGDEAAVIDASTDAFSLPSDEAIAFGLLVNELLTNSVKYGGSVNCAPILVRTTVENNQVTLTVSNDRADEEEIAEGTGIGSNLIKGFVRQLNAEMTTSHDAGRYTVKVAFDLQ